MTTKGDLYQTSNQVKWEYPSGWTEFGQWKQFSVENCYRYILDMVRKSSKAQQDLYVIVYLTFKVNVN